MPLQGANPTPSFGGFGFTLSNVEGLLQNDNLVRSGVKNLHTGSINGSQD